MIATTRLGKSWGERVLFEDVTLTLNPGSRYGLVGANGSGKSTFLRILAGDEPATEGSFTIPRAARMGVLRQDRFMDDAERIVDVAMRGDAEAWSAQQELHRATSGEVDATHVAELEERLRALDGYTLEARASAILQGLGIPTESHAQPLATLSGGFKLRVLLAQVLLGGPDLLLLDEPTNHLDILSIRWLEKFLAAYRGCALVISHDVRFLDNVATHVLDVDYETLTLYTGNFTAFAREKALARERLEAERARQEKVIADKRAFIDRFGAKASKARQAQSRMKQLEKIEVVEVAESSRRAPQFRFEPQRPSGKDVLTVEGLSKSFGSRRVLRGVTFTVRRGERVALLGANGLGKSTLLKIAMERLPADEGSTRWGYEVQPGYFAQDHRDLLGEAGLTPLRFLEAAAPREGQSFHRGMLGRVLLSGDDVHKSVEALSGGEAARLVFSRLMVEKPNVLVLDEPTNHLDLESIDALLAALKAYEGTLLFVSHDRYFVSALATRVLELTAEGLRDFPGTYEDYLARCGDDHLDADTVVLDARRKAREEAQRRAADVDTGRAWEEQKKRRNRARALPARRDKLLADIEAAEKRKQVLAEQYASEGFFERTSREELAKLQSEEEGLTARIEAMMLEWEQVEQELASLAAEEG